MPELKTLKDFNNNKKDYINLEDLRNEAINWIKEMSKVNERRGEPFEISGYIYEQYEATQVIMWIRYFFNIKDEELK